MLSLLQATYFVQHAFYIESLGKFSLGRKMAILIRVRELPRGVWNVVLSALLEHTAASTPSK